jgi:hypothetical protein
MATTRTAGITVADGGHFLIDKRHRGIRIIR